MRDTTRGVMSENCKSIAATSDRAGGNDHRSNDLADIRAFSKANGICIQGKKTSNEKQTITDRDDTN